MAEHSPRSQYHVLGFVRERISCMWLGGKLRNCRFVSGYEITNDERRMKLQALGLDLNKTVGEQTKRKKIIGVKERRWMRNYRTGKVAQRGWVFYSSIRYKHGKNQLRMWLGGELRKCR